MDGKNGHRKQATSQQEMAHMYRIEEREKGLIIHQYCKYVEGEAHEPTI